MRGDNRKLWWRYRINHGDIDLDRVRGPTVGDANREGVQPCVT